MIYQFNDEQQKLLNKLGFEPLKDYDDEANEQLLDAVADHLLGVGFDDNYEANKIGNICEDIITIITKDY